MNLTDEQTGVVDAMQQSAACIKVEAGAGTGKTSTIVAGARGVPNKRGLLTVFNKLMAEETKPRLADTRCDVSTLHSVAYRSDVARPFRSRVTMRLPARTAAQAAGIRGPQVIAGVKLTLNACGYLLLDWVARFCQSPNTELGAKHFPRSTLLDWLTRDDTKRAEQDPAWTKHLVSAVATDLLPNVAILWKRLSDPSEREFPSTHDVYLKLYVMSEPRIAADYVMLDEAQDANPIMLQFMRLAARQGAQTVYVGDSRQQMYSWRGAVDAMGQIDADATLRLTRSFRFGPAVADAANAVLGGLLRSDFRIVGGGGPSSIAGGLSNPTAIICRSNAETLAQALELHDAGVRCGLCMEPAAIRREIESLEWFHDKGFSGDRRYCHFQNYYELEEAIEAGQMPDLKVLKDVIDEYGFDGARAC